MSYRKNKDKHHKANQKGNQDMSHHSTSGYKVPPRCYESHKPLKIGQYLIYGGSCITPAVKDADIYIGFDMGMERHPKRFPWVPGESFLFPITDMSVPSDVSLFKELIEWVSVQLIAGKKVHMGCIGGHGRTGLVMAALVKHMTGEVDAITYVRDNYCQKAVESKAQIEFLGKHFGIKAVAGSKDYLHDTSSRDYVSPYAKGTGPGKVTKNGGLDKGPEKGEITAWPTKHPMSVWGQNYKVG